MFNLEGEVEEEEEENEEEVEFLKSFNYQLESLFCFLFIHSWRENSWIHTFLKVISVAGNVNCFVPDLISSPLKKVIALIWFHCLMAYQPL